MVPNSPDDFQRTYVLLADDQREVRSALRLLLEQEPGFRVSGEAGDVGGLLAQVQAAAPDMVLMDWELPGPQDGGLPAGSDDGLVSALHSLRPALLVVVMSGRPEAREAALAAGADGFASKGDPPERLLKTLRSALAGGTR